MKLNQVIATVTGKKPRLGAILTDIYQKFQKPTLFSGFDRQYKPVNDDDKEILPAEKSMPVENAEILLDRMSSTLEELINSVTTQDLGNMSACGDIIVNGHTICEKVPVTSLLYLEKQLVDLHTSLNAIPTLPVDHDWADIGNNLYKSEATQTHRTRKVQAPMVLYPATDKHPAQTQLITKDELAGYWNKIDFSTAISPHMKAELVHNCQLVLDAVREARELANTIEVKMSTIGSSLTSFILSI